LPPEFGYFFGKLRAHPRQTPPTAYYFKDSTRALRLFETDILFRSTLFSSKLFPEI
jgi:hypothetical protein